ncbi:MAG: efflux RND transporter periplasmic adaptor subunit [Gemmatimonadota bacterium]|nr:efflux RND transporter periplasmic adaptor subunit [Gemmatimonadota bacterium]
MEILEIDDMRQMRKWVALTLAGVAMAACGSAQAENGDTMADAEGFVRVINVQVRSVQPERFVEEIRLTSVAMANQDVTIAAEESGVIRELFVDRGDRVRQGDPIAKIDDRVLSAQVDQARATADLAAQTWDRRKRLWEEERVGSEIAYLEARYAAEQTAASLAGLQERLARTVVRAPFEGVLDQRFVDVGAMVNSGSSIGRLLDLTPIKVFAGVPERYAADVSVGDEAILTFEALGNEVYTASIRYVGSSVDPQNRTFPIEVVLTNPDSRIKPQMVANMGITRRAFDAAIVLPQDALVRVETGYIAFVVVERDGHQVAEARPVVLGPARRNLVVAESGVAAGERLIVVGQKAVEDGDRINIVGEGR